MMEDLALSLSGGETSEFLRRLVMSPFSKYGYTYKKIHTVFCNTGLEHPKTIDFLKRIQDLMGQQIVALEAYPQARGKGTQYQIVDLDSIDMTGAPMERVIAKYGLPNKGYLHCTRETKITPFHQWCKANLTKKYETAIGIRADEIDRMSEKASESRIIYPLVRYEITKPIVNAYFETQPWRLDIPGYLGNCQACYKKSDKKLALVYAHDKTVFDFWRRMERDYGSLKQPRKIFRMCRTTDELVSSFDVENDESNGCGGSEACVIS